MRRYAVPQYEMRHACLSVSSIFSLLTYVHFANVTSQPVDFLTLDLSDRAPQACAAALSDRSQVFLSIYDAVTEGKHAIAIMRHRVYAPAR